MRRHVPTFRARYHECDAQGVMFNAHYLALFDMAIGELWREVFGGYSDLTDRGKDIVVGESHVRYLQPVVFDDLIQVAIEVAEMGTTSMKTEYEVLRDGDLLATGWVRHVFVDLVDGAVAGKTPIPDDIRAKLSEELSSSAGPR